MFSTLAFIAALAAAPHSTAGRPPHSTFSVATYQGTFADGATYLIQVPQSCNGTVVLYSHGYVLPGSANPAYDVGDGTTGAYLLEQGYALAGSSYATTGWAVQQALPDQMEVLSIFPGVTGKQPTRIVAWGHSMGGLITAALVQQNPGVFAGAMPMCGVVSGGVGFWNTQLDSAYAFNELIAGGSLQVVGITDPTTNLDNAEGSLAYAQGSAAGQARIALAAALGNTPGWYTTGDAPPGRTDWAAQEQNQYEWLGNASFLFGFYLEAELEGRAGGNPTWNSGVDYAAELRQSSDFDEVKHLYEAAGIDLSADLATLDSNADIAAVPAALQYLTQNIIFDGKLAVPVFALHTIGDGTVVNENETAYASAVNGAGNGAYLRQLFVNRAGHCAFTSAEEIAGFEALIARIDSGTWTGVSPYQLNAVARALGSNYNGSFKPAYKEFTPGAFMRTYDGNPSGSRFRPALLRPGA